MATPGDESISQLATKAVLNDTDLLVLVDNDGVATDKSITGALEKQSAAQYRSFDIAPASAPTTEGKIYWDENDHTLAITTDYANVALQTGQEIHIRVTNKSGVDIDDGEVVYISGAQGQRPTVVKAQANLNATIEIIGVATHDIANNEDGMVTTFGIVRGLDTDSFSAGDTLYISPTVAGALTNVKPITPNYELEMGIVLVSNPGNGSIFVVHESKGHAENVNLLNLTNGYLLQEIALAVSSNGSTITASLDAAVGTTLSFSFSDGITDVDVSTPLTVTVTPAAADTTPAERWLYILQSDPTTFVESTSGFPAAEHAKIGRLVVQTAAGVQNNGLLKQHNYTNALADGNLNGDLDHIAKWVRLQHASWMSGVAWSISGSGTGTINVATTAGVISQMHEHVFAAHTSPATLFVVNESATPYKKITNVGGEILTDSTGTTLNNKWYTLVLWGSGSQGGSGADKLYINVPSGSYNTITNANLDPNGYANTAIPDEFKGVGFLIAKIVLKNVASTTWTWDNTGNNNLRGFFPNTDAGSSTAIATMFADSTFEIFSAADDTKLLMYDASGITTATTRTWTIQDDNLTIIGKDGSAVIDALTSTISNVVDPTSDQDAATKVWVESQLAGKDEFAELGDVTGAYTTAGAIYRTNGTTDGLEETTILVNVPAANQLTIDSGTTRLGLTADLDVTASTTISDIVSITSALTVGTNPVSLNQSLTKTSTPEFLTVSADNMFSEVKLITESGTARTISNLDRSATLMSTNNGGAVVITLPTDAANNLDLGFNFAFLRNGTSTVAFATGATLNSADGATKIRVQYASAYCVKTGADTWQLFGDLEQ